MAEDLIIQHGDKKTQYESLIPQIKGLMTGEKNLVANLGNITAVQLVMGGLLLGD